MQASAADALAGDKRPHSIVYAFRREILSVPYMG